MESPTPNCATQPPLRRNFVANSRALVPIEAPSAANLYIRHFQSAGWALQLAVAQRLEWLGPDLSACGRCGADFKPCQLAPLFSCLPSGASRQNCDKMRAAI